MKREERVAQWAEHIEGWKRSGLTQPRYCERESISYDTFKRWRRRLGKGQGRRSLASRFVPISLAGVPARSPMPLSPMSMPGHVAPGAGAQIRLSNGRAIGLGKELDEVELGRLIRLLEVLPC